MGNKKFAVSFEKPELIVPANPTPHEIKLLSDIDDQHGLRLHFSITMFYDINNIIPNSSIIRGSKEDPVWIIKEAIAKALVYYYPIAGRLIEGPNKKLIVNCNGEGILFVEAHADVRIKQLQDVNVMYELPCPKEFLVDIPSSLSIVACPLMLIQVSFCLFISHVTTLSSRGKDTN